MAQPIDIQIQRSLTNTPTTLLYGEPAWDDINKGLYIGDSSGDPILINNILAVAPINGQVPRWDGTRYVNSDLLNTGRDGCSVLTIDDTGLDWCNYQVGNSGSAFQTLKKSNGTVALPTALLSGNKIGGIGFIGEDEATSNPGYVGAEIASFVTEDQNATSGGAELRFLVTANGTKASRLSFVIENDGTVTVGSQANYELQVLDNNDIPNKKYVDDAIINNVSTSIGDLVDVDLTASPQENGSLLKWNSTTSQYESTLFQEENNGAISVDASLNYETLVTTDDVLTNKAYVDNLFSGLSGAADMSAVQLRKTTVHNISNGSFNTVDFDIADVENNTSVLEHNDSDTTQILIKETGIYLLTYDLHSDGNGIDKDFRVLVNGTTTLEGSQSIRNDSTDDNRSSVGITLISLFNAGDFIQLQTQANGTGAVLDPPSVFGIVRLKGSKGDSGDTGADGADGIDGDSGPMGFGIYAWSETDADGTQLESQELSVTNNAAGIYDYTFDTAATNANYNVFIQPVYNNTPLNTVEVEVYNKANTGFTVRTNQQDDGGGTGTNLNFRHSVAVLGVGSGLPTGTVQKGAAPDNEFVFFNGTTLNSNGSIVYDTTVNNINIESQNTTSSALNINTTNGDADWLSFSYNNDFVGGFFGVAADPGDLGLILGDVSALNTIIYQGTVNTSTAYQINNVGLSLYHLADTAASTQTPSVGDVLRWNGTEWVEVTPPVPVFEPGILRISSQGADQSNNYNTTTLQPLVLTGSLLSVGLGSTYFNNNNGTITCNFDGVVKVSYAIPHFTTGSRESLKTTIQKNNVNYSAASYGYIRDSQGHRRDDNTGSDLVDVNTGDTIRIGVVRAENSTAGVAVTLEANCTIILERVQ